jgi:hypothetical protein
MDTEEELLGRIQSYCAKINWQLALIQEFRTDGYDTETAMSVLVGLQISLRHCEEQLADLQKIAA